eukprot:COSAG03_NODE_12535_length_542_cov_1264.428894_1_plen_93_part_10
MRRLKNLKRAELEKKLAKIEEVSGARGKFTVEELDEVRFFHTYGSVFTTHLCILIAYRVICRISTTRDGTRRWQSASATSSMRTKLRRRFSLS